MASDQLLTKKLGEEFKCTGEWWIPNASDSNKHGFKHCGTLTFSRDEGIKLSILGWFDGQELPEDPSGDRFIEMIWGFSTEGENITLVGCQRDGITVGQKSTESYLIDDIFVSKKAWFNPNEDISFKSLALQYTSLQEWVGIGGIQSASIEELQKFAKERTLHIEYRQPEKPASLNVRGYTLTIQQGVSWPLVKPAAPKAIIEQSTSLLITPRASAEITLNEVRTLTAGIQNLLSLLTYDRIYPLVIEGKAKVESETTENESEAVMRLLYKPLASKQPSTEISQRDMLFTYEDIANDLENALSKMIVVADDKLKPVFDQFFAEYFSSSAYVEDGFMSVIRAIESFHRRTCDRDYYVEKREYEDKYFERFYTPVKNTVDESDLPEDLRQSFLASLKSKLSYGYEYSLRRRLNELFKSPYGEEFLTLFVITQEEKEQLKNEIENVKTEEEKEEKRKQWVKKKTKKFVDEVVFTRNWFTHFDEDDKQQAIRGGKELAYLSLKLELFIIILLLDYIDIPLEEVKKRLKHHKFDYLRAM